MIYFLPFFLAMFGFYIKSRYLFYFVIFFCLVLIYGFRHHIGTDWNNYLLIYQKYLLDPDYSNPSAGYAFDWLSRYIANYGVSVHFLNAILFGIFAFGIVYYCSKLYSGYVVFCYLLGYLIPVVMVGVRQAAAIGVIFVLASVYRKSSLLVKLVLLSLAYGFHASSLILLSAVIMDITQNTVRRILLMIPVFLFALYYGLQEDAYGYLVLEQVTSTGAIAHMALVALPILAFLRFTAIDYRRFLASLDSLQLAMIGVLIMSFGLFFLNSTVADRFSLYAYPLTAFCVSSLIKYYRSNFVKIVYFLIGIALFYLWYFFANNSATFWKYENLFFMT